MAFCETKVSSNWWFRANSKKYFSLLRVYCDWAFPSFKNSVKREAIKQTTTFAGASRPSKLRFAVDSTTLISSRMAPRALRRLSSILWVLQNIGKKYCTQKIKQQQKIYSRASSSSLALLQAEMNCDRVSFHSAIFCLFVCFLCDHHSITINHTDPKSLALSRSERGPEFKTSSF